MYIILRFNLCDTIKDRTDCEFYDKGLTHAPYIFLFNFYYVVCQYILFPVVCQYTLYYDSTDAMMMMTSCRFAGLYDLDSDL